MREGFLYVANQKKFIDEAMISSRSLRQFSKLPIALVCTHEIASKEVYAFFDDVIIHDEMKQYIYLAKVLGIQLSPFDRTIFLDTDTFICDDISPLFELMELVDIATSIEKSHHTTDKIKNIRFKNIIPEFNSGVIVYKKNEITERLFKDWFQVCVDNKMGNDMPGLRESVIKNFKAVKFVILPEEYNSHGYKSMLQLNGKVKVIHERLGIKWNSITPFFLPFDKGAKFARKINKKSFKRIYIPYIGIIPYNWSPINILLKLKKMIGVKSVSKNR